MSVTDPAILIVGTGFAGIGMAIRLKQAGFHDFVLLERADNVGGTWRDNHYPGAACDIESPLYSFSFEPYPSWTRMFAPQAEILRYLVHCVDKYGLRPHLRLRTEVTAAHFDEAAAAWNVSTADGQSLRARVVISCCGGLSRPAEPDIAGLGQFQGTLFHSARWNHDYDLHGKTVAVIGTGASAVQLVPQIAPQVGRLHLYQRNPPWILPKRDRDIPPHEREWLRRLPFLQQLTRLRQYLLHELSAIGFVYDPRILKLAEGLVHRYLKASVADPELRKKLTPSYAMGCKRILISNDYYPAVQRTNVELVTAAIREVRAHGIVTQDGQERAVDTIVLATGFQAAEAVAPFAVHGRRGSELGEVWDRGAEAYLGTAITGFPNLFLIVGPNTGLGHNSMVYMIESQIAYILDGMLLMRRRGLQQVEVRPEVQTRYNQALHARFPGTVWSSGCTSWYRTRSGKNTTLWPGFTFEFRRRTRRFDAHSYTLLPSAGGAPG